MGEKGMESPAPSRIGTALPGSDALSRVAGASSMASPASPGGLSGLRQAVGGTMGGGSLGEATKQDDDMIGQPPKG